MRQQQVTVPISKIIKKNGEELPVKRETGEKIRQALMEADQHIFINVTELGRTINSTEIDEVKDTVEVKYQDMPEEKERPMTEEERKKVREAIETIRRQMKFGKYQTEDKDGNPLKKETHCVCCGKKLPTNLARVCSGECYVASKEGKCYNKKVDIINHTKQHQHMTEEETKTAGDSEDRKDEESEDTDHESDGADSTDDTDSDKEDK